jgi:hypothetical protein
MVCGLLWSISIMLFIICPIMFDRLLIIPTSSPGNPDPGMPGIPGITVPVCDCVIAPGPEG